MRTLDFGPVDGLDGNLGAIDLAVALEDVAELTGPDLLLQHVYVHSFGHFYRLYR